MPRGRPLITANQVTLARLIPMPLLSWLLYRGGEQGYAHNVYMTSALIAGTVIGCTDWIDGLLARKYGPTVLGGLLDPIADKIFIAFAYTPFVDVSPPLIPWWMVALLFQREFFVTALRSAYEQRNLTLKTSYLAKAKTWTQMQGIGVMLLFPLVENPRPLTWVLGIGVVSPLVAMLVLYVMRRKLWRGALVMSASFVAILALHLHGDLHLTITAIMLWVVGITWFSGLDYLVVGWKQLRGRGDFSRADAVRLIGALALPMLLYPVLLGPGPAWPIFLILAGELAVGGLDNLLSHHRRATKALAWGGRVLGVCVLLGAALVVPAYAGPLSILASAVSLVGVAAEFWRGRDYFLDKRIRDKVIREAEAAPEPPPPPPPGPAAGSARAADR
ncbi:MAG TPA: CDP-alcohol phosphatidyltransferase family protein [Kofleriaceae bacterium]|nr:CDP-alcohol phosphatidyltransferase family protein [Kofleriaceae bacterium]